MAGLANGVPVVTNLGTLSEPLWGTTDGVKAIDSPTPALLVEAAEDLLVASHEARRALGNAGRSLYKNMFSVEGTVSRLRQTDCPFAAPAKLS